VPMAALLAGGALAFLWQTRGRWARAGQGLALVLAVLMVLAPHERLLRAFDLTEYDGVSAALAPVARQLGPADIVLVDHPWWGMPLAFIYGKNVLNGAGLWEYPPAVATNLAVAAPALQRLVRSGSRVRLVTSSEDGIGIYPSGIGPASLDYESPSVTFRVVTHASRATRLAGETRTFRFRVYTLQAAP
jgi:hypothetical protein